MAAGDIILFPLQGADGAGDIRLGSNGYIQLYQQYLEVIESGQTNVIRLAQQYVEVIHTFGTPPIKPGGKPSDPPGKGKKTAAYLATSKQRRLNTERRLSAAPFLPLLPAQYLSPGAKNFLAFFERTRRLRETKERARLARQQNAYIPAATIAILPQEYVPPEPTRTVWRDIVKYKTLT